MKTCHDVRPFLDALVDGELSAEQTLAAEAHMSSCENCREELKFFEAVKHSTRRAESEHKVTSLAFEERIREAIRSEAVREEQAREQEAKPVVRPVSAWVQSLGWRSAIPLAAVAALALWFQSGFPTSHRSQPDQRRTERTVQEATLGPDQALDRLIDYHSSPPPAQVTNQDLVTVFERDVGVRVHAPHLEKFGAMWEGAGVVNVRNYQAAYLRYRMPGRHVTVYVYDARKVPVHRTLIPRMVHEHPVYVGEWRGYTVAAKEHRGIGYALASDLDDTQTAELLTEMR